MAGQMVCSGMLGLSGADGAALPPGWSAIAPNGGNKRSIVQNATPPPGWTGSTDINNQTIRNFVGGAYVTPQSPINMGAFYNGAPTYSFGSTSVLTEGATFIYVVNTDKVPNGAVLTWEISGGTINQFYNPKDITTSITGSFIINNNQGTFAVTTNADATTEGTEYFLMTIKRSGGVAVLSRVESIVDTSQSWSATAGTYTNPVAEGASGVFNINTANIPNGTTLYVTYSYMSGSLSAANFSSQPSSFVVNNNAGSVTYTTIANNLPNYYLGTFNGVQAYQLSDQTLRLNIYRDNLPSNGGTLLFNGPNITIQDSTYGTANFINFIGPAGSASNVSLCISYNGSLPSGWTKSGGPYRLGLNNLIAVGVPAGADYRGTTVCQPGLRIQGGQQTLDAVYIVVNGIVRGKGGNGANGGNCGNGYVGGNAIEILGHSGGTVTIANSSGYIAGGGGGGGGSGSQVGLGGGGAGGGDGGRLCNPGYFNSAGSICLNTNGGNGTISGTSNRYRWGGGGGSYLPAQAVPPQREPYGMGEVGGSGGGAAGYGGGQGGGGGGCWQFTGPSANTIRGGRGGKAGAAGGGGAKLINNNLIGAVGGGGGGWGAAGGGGGALATGNATLSSTRSGGAGGNAIKLNGAIYSGPGGATIYGAVN